MTRVILYAVVVFFLGLWMSSVSGLEWLGNGLKCSSIGVISVVLVLFFVEKLGILKRIKKK